MRLLSWFYCTGLSTQQQYTVVAQSLDSSHKLQATSEAQRHLRAAKAQPSSPRLLQTNGYTVRGLSTSFPSYSRNFPFRENSELGAHALSDQLAFIVAGSTLVSGNG